MVIHSLTGGTGSGLGSRLLEVIKDTYPLAHAVSVAVAPHVSGDSPLQHYNSLLSLASLQRYVLFLIKRDKVPRGLRYCPGYPGGNGTVLGALGNYIVHPSVMSGYSPLQHYNSLISLASVQQYVLFFDKGVKVLS